MQISHWLSLPLAVAGLALSLEGLGQDAVLELHVESLPAVLPGTISLDRQGDIASDLVDGVDRFLLTQLRRSVELRQTKWPKPAAAGNSREDYLQALAPLRQRYREAIGLVDPRIENPRLNLDSSLRAETLRNGAAAHVASFEGGKIFPVRWQVHDGLDAQGLIVVPNDQPTTWNVVLIPDAGQMPEDLCGRETENRIAIELAQRGATVLIPQGVSRHRQARNGRSIMTDQEYLYRSAFVLGRHVLGHQVQQSIAALEILQRESPQTPVAIAGWGEGGWIALAAGASEPRFDAVLVSGHFGPKEQLWQEPIHRNVHGLLADFGDAQLAAMIAPRPLIIDPSPGPSVDIPGEGGAPGKLHGPSIDEAQREWQLARDILQPWNLADAMMMSPSAAPLPDPQGRPSPESIALLAQSLAIPATAPSSTPPAIPAWEPIPDRELRRIDLLSQWDRYQQRLLDLAHLERGSYWKNLDTSTPERFRETVEPYRQDFSERVIGRWDLEPRALNPKTRLVYDEPKWRGYEVVLDVFDDVIAYGVLLVPKSDQPIRNRPCVVFQHGLEGRPGDTIAGDHPAYHNVSAQLAEEGYVVFAPQNLYLFTDRFRTLQRKSNLLGKTLFSTIVAQHQQIVRWLASREEINPQQIAFYGLSYGGKSAMRIPALVPEYCLSICSADFNDWVWKNASTSAPYSYVWSLEYEIFEFDLGRKFNYAEMAALIAPRPFMVERGHFDTVAPDERVGLEYAKVQNLYAAKLKIPERTEIEWFDGPHTIHGVGTFAFLRKHLRPEAPNAGESPSEK
ncbi:MAG: dienelactone hydrolase family protein [Planctomycetota bacterium]|jgi:dienelactone hydrolase